MSDIIELSNFSDTDSYSGGKGGSTEVNFGGGLEYLMNSDATVRSTDAGSLEVRLDDLDTLDDELATLGDASANKSSLSNLFDVAPEIEISADDDDTASASASAGGNEDQSRAPPKFNVSFDATNDKGYKSDGPPISETWDGYSMMNNSSQSTSSSVPPTSVPASQTSKVDQHKQKCALLRKIRAKEKKGVEFAKQYTMESPYHEMKSDYDSVADELRKQASIKFQGEMLMYLVTGVEYLNAEYDPLDINLDGLGETVSENLDELEGDFDEIDEEYNSSAFKMNPIGKVCIKLIGMGIMTNMSNKMLKSSNVPGVDTIMKQNPDLMKAFQSAAIKTMGAENPGVGNFMTGIMEQQNNMSTRSGGPPPPISMGAARQQPSQSRQSNAGLGAGPEKTPRSRAEMTGPADISDILNTLKSKSTSQTHSLPQQTQSRSVPSSAPNSGPPLSSRRENDSSTISISDMKTTQGGSLPKRSKNGKSSRGNAAIRLNI